MNRSYIILQTKNEELKKKIIELENKLEFIKNKNNNKVDCNNFGRLKIDTRTCIDCSNKNESLWNRCVIFSKFNKRRTNYEF